MVLSIELNPVVLCFRGNPSQEEIEGTTAVKWNTRVSEGIRENLFDQHYRAKRRQRDRTEIQLLQFYEQPYFGGKP
jgi:hypothetical protein